MLHRDLVQHIIEKVSELEKEYSGLAPLNILLSDLNLEYNLNEKEILNGLNELTNKNIVKKEYDNYYKRCY